MKIPSRESLSSFFRTGLLIMSFALLLTIGLKQHPELQATISSAWTSPTASVSQFTTNEPMITLTLNAAWHTGSDASFISQNISSLLTVLQEADVTATFFLSDAWLEHYPEETQAIAAAGQEIGLLWDTSCKDLKNSVQKLEGLTSSTCRYVRPAHGEYNEQLLSDITALNLSCILWTLDAEDWKDYDSNVLTRFIVEHPELKKGAILQFHCQSKQLPEALPFLIQELQEHKYEIVPLSQIFQQLS